MTRITGRTGLRRTARGALADLRVAVVPWALARVLVLGALALTRHVADGWNPAGRPVSLSQGLFAWDGAYYRAIAEYGYPGRASLRFFPLYPLVGRWSGWVLGGHDDVALLLIANVAALAFGALLHRLTLRETGDADTARRAAWYAALFPAASVMVMGYADPVMAALAVATFWALRRRSFALAGVLGLLAALTRPLGVLLLVPAVVEVWRARHGAGGRGWAVRIAALAGPVVGLGIYCGWVERAYGDGWLPFSVQQRANLRGDFVDPVSRLVRAAGDLLDGDRFGSGLHLLWAVVFLALLVVVARRLPASYAWFSAATLLVALSSDNLDSLERYAMGAFPLLMALAIVTRRPQVERAALVAAGSGLVAYGVLVFAGLSVP